MAALLVPHLAAACPSLLQNLQSVKIAETSKLNLRAHHLSKVAFSRKTGLVCSILEDLSLAERNVDVKRNVIVKASSETASLESGSNEESGVSGEAPVEDADKLAKLQFQSDLDRKIERKKVARRRRLLQKRRLRKKGAWPPSKMKKLANV